MLTGRITMWNVDRGYGFIAPDGGGADVFCHITDCNSVDALRVGQSVKFNEASRDGRPRAVEVGLLDALPKGRAAVMAQRREPPDALDYFPTPPWASRALFRHVLPSIGVDAFLAPGSRPAAKGIWPR